ncbi:DUF1304 domain-containing protein [Nonlabens xiamenensis]|uniref:DUF1304 domain-containing protein n=1 Tax=Nonlabens xiamenensis TaxID=2341043 RepID=UPI000F60B821|nr:DUF1304 domain-containing protein [Nonlabens xiamenensis]
MKLPAQILIGLIAILHIYIMYLEMFAWERKGPKVFRNLPKELFRETKAMAANQGLYNGFLAAGLAWTFFIENPTFRDQVSYFFLGCVMIAGIYGAITVDKKTVYIQTVPAVIAMFLLAMSL